MTKKQITETLKKMERESYGKLQKALEENNGVDNELTNLLRQRWGAINEVCIALDIPT